MKNTQFNTSFKASIFSLIGLYSLSSQAANETIEGIYDTSSDEVQAYLYIDSDKKTHPIIEYSQVNEESTETYNETCYRAPVYGEINYNLIDLEVQESGDEYYVSSNGVRIAWVGGELNKGFDKVVVTTYYGMTLNLQEKVKLSLSEGLYVLNSRKTNAISASRLMPYSCYRDE